MFKTVEANTGTIVARGTTDIQLVRILASIAKVEEGCVMREKGNNPALPETVYLISRDTISRIRRNPEVIDATLSVTRRYAQDLDESKFRTNWHPTDSYQIVARGINLEVFEGEGEAIKQAIELQRPGIQKLWSAFQQRLSPH